MGGLLSRLRREKRGDPRGWLVSRCFSEEILPVRRHRCVQLRPAAAAAAAVAGRARGSLCCHFAPTRCREGARVHGAEAHCRSTSGGSTPVDPPVVRVGRSGGRLGGGGNLGIGQPLNSQLWGVSNKGVLNQCDRGSPLRATPKKKPPEPVDSSGIGPNVVGPVVRGRTATRPRFERSDWHFGAVSGACGRKQAVAQAFSSSASAKLLVLMPPSDPLTPL